MNSTHSALARSIALALTVSGCELIGPQFHQKLPLPAPAPVSQATTVGEAGAEDGVRSTKVERFDDSDSQPLLPAASRPSMASSGKGEYSLNFDDADIAEVAKVILGDILGRNYTISPQVSGKVSLQTAKPLTKDELLPTLEMLLGLNNAALISQGDVWLIKPSSEALYSASIKAAGGARIPSGYQTRVVPVKNVAAGEIAEILKPLLPEKALLQVDAKRNLVLVAGSGADINRALEMVSLFDVDVLKGRSFALFTPAHVDAGKIIEELNQVFNQDDGNSKEAAPDAKPSRFFRFIEIERLNAILAITHQARYLNDIESWVLRLDRTSTEAGGGVNVYRAQHVNAVELADTLNEIFGNGGQRRNKSASIAAGRKTASASTAKKDNPFGGASGSGSSGGKDPFMDKSLSDKNSSKNSSGGGLLGSNSSANSNGDSSSVRIIADEGNNALVIVANAQDYATIQRLLKQLDVLPLQVMIDATIVEVNLRDDLQYGIQWYLQHENAGAHVISGGAPNGLDINKVASGIASGGFSYAFTSNSKDVNAVLQAGATNNNINVISSPSLMVLNNQEASIKVGDSVPVRSSVSTNLNSSATAPIQTSSIQMIDTGVNLSVRPRVNAGGLVLMDILQSVNEATTTTTSQSIDSPTIQKREIETSVAVQSGETVVLGGLIKENNDYKRFGIPLLHQIPLLGPLFGSTTRNKDKNELVVLLTPRVMKSRQDAQDVTDEFKRKLSGIYAAPLK